MTIWATGITLKSGGTLLAVSFEGGDQVSIPAMLLRVESPSAEVQGHGPGQKVIVTGKENIRIMDVQPVGHYAVRLVFDDGHDTGLYTWDYLHKLGKVAALQN